MNDIEKQVEKFLGKKVYILSSKDDKHFTVHELRSKELERFYYKWGEKVYAVNEDISDLAKYAEQIVFNNLMMETEKFKNNKSKIFSLKFFKTYHISYKQFIYDGDTKEYKEFISY